MIKTRKCYKCKKEISYNEKQCPWCNATQINPILGVIIFSVLVVIIFFTMTSDNTSQKWSDAIKVTTIEEKIEKQFTSWDGSHIQLKKYIKNNLKDPNSFEHIKTTYTPTPITDIEGNEYITVNMEYRAKNSFWWYIVETYKAFYSIEGLPIKIDNWGVY